MIPCMMLDLSDAGARLKLDAKTEVPAEFILVLSRDGRLNRPCRIVWREEETFGVRFLARQSINPKPKPEKARRPGNQPPEDLHKELAAEIAAADAPELVPELPK